MEEHLYSTVLDMDLPQDPSKIANQGHCNGYLVLSSTVVWLAVFLSIYKGVTVVSNVVLVTVDVDMGSNS